MTVHLVSRPIPIPGESPASILMRAVEGNGYPSLQALIWSYWKNNSSREWAKAAHTDPVRYEEILSALGIDLPQIDSVCFRREGPTSESARVMDGMYIPEDMFREDGRYFCPKCLEQRPYWRRKWAIRAYSVCTEHRVYLLRDCPSCSSELKVDRGEIAKCSCGVSLKELVSEPADSSAVDWWLQLHQNSLEVAQKADALFLALSEVDSSAGDPMSEHRRLCSVRSWMDNGEIDATVMETLGKESILHPRLLLLPLLRRSDIPEIDRFARAVLNQWRYPGNKLEFSGETAISRRDAGLALGISEAQFRKFMKTTLLDFPSGDKPRRGQLSVAAVNRLLFSLHATKGEMTDSVGRAPTCSIASMAASVLSGERESAGYDVAEGLSSLRLTRQMHDKQLEADEMAEWLDTNQVAEKLGTYPEAVRFLRIKGWLEFRDRDLRGKKRYIASRQNVDQFHQAYVLGGTIASQLGINPTNLSEKLMALGVQPVAGPRIDGLLVYLFRRNDIERVDLAVLPHLEKYPTNTGRKRKSGECADEDGPMVEMTANSAAAELGVRPCDVHTLIRKGILERVSTLTRDIFVSRKSVLSLQRQLHRDDFISVEDAAKRLGLSPGMLKSRWIKSGVLHAQDLGLWRRIATRELGTLEDLLADYVTAAEAGRMLNMHRSHLPNLERRGVVTSKKIGSGQGVRLYARSHLENLRRLGNLKSE